MSIARSRCGGSARSSPARSGRGRSARGTGCGSSRPAATAGCRASRDPAPPRHADAERIALRERGDVAATIHAPVRVEDLRHVLDDGALTGVEQAAGWAFSRAWLEELRAGLEARIAAADPLDPGVPGPAEPWAAAGEPRLGLERRGAEP